MGEPSFSCMMCGHHELLSDLQLRMNALHKRLGETNVKCPECGTGYLDDPTTIFNTRTCKALIQKIHKLSLIAESAG